MVAGEQDLRHTPAPVLRGAGVVGVLGVAFEGGAEGLLRRRVLVPEGPGELAHDRVAQHHRRELPAAEHVATDRDDVAGEVLEDALVEALIAAAQQRQLLLAGELIHELVVEQAAAGRQRDHPAALAQQLGVDPVAGPQRAVEHVHPQQHPGSAPERGVVDLARRQRRVLADVDQLQRGARPPARWPRGAGRETSRTTAETG